MNEHRGTREERRAHPPYLLLLALAFSNAACLLISQDPSTETYSWSRAHGSVIPHDSFPADCGLCHLSEDWNALREDFSFDHLAETGVKLEGSHEQAQCLRCHNDRGPVAIFAARGCAGCHQDPHQSRLGTTCEDCHSEVDWRPREQIAQHARTRFPLFGAHAGVSCVRCHPGSEIGNFQRASIDCESCHFGELDRPLSPDHVALGWTSDCERCHVPTGWRDGRFDHSNFPLVGRHRAAKCSSCHTSGVYQGTPRDCMSCHLGDYNQARNPNHLAAGFSTSCEQCHNPNSWRGARYDHNSWLLTGRHNGASCQSCHGSGVYQGTPRNCSSCHSEEYRAARDPNHIAAGIGMDCETCHTTLRWQGANYEHPFPLTGIHRLDCSSCHTAPGTYNFFDCTDCHAHKQGKMGKKHRNVAMYLYFSQACYNCHPRGR